ncbi:Glyoxalase/bleomycin resistance protein/dioxygenase [Sphingobium chlorophenolicum L-1]|uniref:Glyoxalase/bleomycin resistance protein/dioxygenase n=1 Tax=Sphingobium chlorophenolicum L-1 TaxID=690566 RepID=F6EZ87_SPHCR|nr:VOC family protein [Sphingobium chlorophenolicum]AEG50180.1 Glyoxalase/bleomycin resistance protein/dioxygenase [Sphingobium chlorophenolicum L-1]
MTDPIMRADAVAYVVFARRDIATMVRFLEDFGFVDTRISLDQRRFLRGYGSQPYCVELIASDQDGFVGFGFTARSANDLERLAQATGATVEPHDAPGGGQRLRLHDPDGVRVDVVHGGAPVAPLPVREALSAVNTPTVARRINTPLRTELAPSPVFRIGHVVLQSTNFETTSSWYAQHLGVLPTDILSVADGSPALGFFRLDRGQEPTDHHSLAILAGPSPAMLHISTETIDLDAIGQGHQYLRGRGWSHHWGIGRHLLGSQIFDYWKDPVGDEWEHYADGDLMTADHPTGHDRLSRAGLWVWGDDLPESMRPPGPLPADAPPIARRIVDALLVPPRPWLP